jgi:hypothetical protein
MTKAECYRQAAEFFAEPTFQSGLCYVLACIWKFDLRPKSEEPMYDSKYLKDMFPEFCLFEPDRITDFHAFWFENNERVIVALLCEQMCND